MLTTGILQRFPHRDSYTSRTLTLHRTRLRCKLELHYPRLKTRARARPQKQDAVNLLNTIHNGLYRDDGKENGNYYNGLYRGYITLNPKSKTNGSFRFSLQALRFAPATCRRSTRLSRERSLRLTSLGVGFV